MDLHLRTPFGGRNEDQCERREAGSAHTSDTRRLVLLIRPASFGAQQRSPLSHRPLSTLCYSCLPSSTSPTLDLRTEVALESTSLCSLRALPSQQLLKPSRRPAGPLTPACSISEWPCQVTLTYLVIRATTKQITWRLSVDVSPPQALTPRGR